MSASIEEGSHEESDLDNSLEGNYKNMTEQEKHAALVIIIEQIAEADPNFTIQKIAEKVQINCANLKFIIETGSSGEWYIAPNILIKLGRLLANINVPAQSVEVGGNEAKRLIQEIKEKFSIKQYHIAALMGEDSRVFSYNINNPDEVLIRWLRELLNMNEMRIQELINNLDIPKSMVAPQRRRVRDGRVEIDKQAFRELIDGIISDHPYLCLADIISLVAPTPDNPKKTGFFEVYDPHRPSSTIGEKYEEYLVAFESLSADLTRSCLDENSDNPTDKQLRAKLKQLEKDYRISQRRILALVGDKNSTIYNSLVKGRRTFILQNTFKRVMNFERLVDEGKIRIMPSRYKRETVDRDKIRGLITELEKKGLKYNELALLTGSTYSIIDGFMRFYNDKLQVGLAEEIQSLYDTLCGAKNSDEMAEIIEKLLANKPSESQLMADELMQIRRDANSEDDVLALMQEAGSSLSRTQFIRCLRGYQELQKKDYEILLSLYPEKHRIKIL